MDLLRNINLLSLVMEGEFELKKDINILGRVEE
jgi:hypothetical protein